jgi:type IV pilus assembly protein PilQ
MENKTGGDPMKGLLRLFIVALVAMTMIRCSTASTDDNGDLSQFGASDQDFASFDSGSSASNDQAANTSSEDEIEKELNASEGTPAASAGEANMDDAEVPPKAAAEATPPAEDQQASAQQQTDDQQQTAPQAQAAATLDNSGSGNTDEFSEFDDNGDQQQQQAQQPATPEQNPPPPDVEPAPEEQAPTPPVATEAPPAPEAPEVAPAPEAPAPEVAQEAPAPEQTTEKVRIKDIRYQANDAGGTVVIDANGPMTYQTRVNEDSHQFVIEIQNAVLPSKLKRTLNTKDMSGAIGAIDAYQNKGSTTARIVVQLRDGASEPTVNTDGNSLLVSEGSAAASSVAQNGGSLSVPQSQILSSTSMQDFLSGNMQFYGKKISLETSDMDVRDVFKLIAEESGVNLVLGEDVKGTISLKLRQVPWDQALVMIMKAKKLGYTRSGNVIRIASMTDIRAEEDDALKMALAKKATDPLKVRLIPISYAKIDDLKTQVAPFLSDRGKVVGDVRTSSLVVSDVAENIDRVVKLVQAIDVPPPQVLIEGKIVEATDSFERAIGVSWATAGQPVVFGSSGHGPITGNLNTIAVSPGISGGAGSAAGTLSFTLGTLDVLGTLNATLSLFESQGIAKVLSSPRILTLQNEPAEISQSTELPILQTNLVQGSGQSTNVTFKPVKLRLAVTPQITNDGAVIMAVDVLREFAGAVVDQTSKAFPVNSRAAKSKVLVKNGQTAVIGGIYQSDMTQNDTKVPWLGDIPVLGWLFHSQDVIKDKSELIVFLTPRIMSQSETPSVTSSDQSGSSSSSGDDQFSGGEVE